MANKPRRNQSVQKAIQLLELFQSRSELSAREAADLLRLPIGSIYPILYALEDAGYLKRVNGARFMLGYKFLEKANIILRNCDILNVAKPFLYKLSRCYNVNSHLGILHRWKVIYLHRELGNETPVISEVIGLQEAPYCTALGKALLSGLTDDQLIEYIRQENFVPLTLKTIIDPNKLLHEIRKVRHNGFALSIEEAHEGIIGIGSPIYDFRGAVIGAISISVAKERYEREKVQLIKAVKGAAAGISEGFGACAYIKRRKEVIQDQEKTNLNYKAVGQNLT